MKRIEETHLTVKITFINSTSNFKGNKKIKKWRRWSGKEERDGDDKEELRRRKRNLQVQLHVDGRAKRMSNNESMMYKENFVNCHLLLSPPSHPPQLPPGSFSSLILDGSVFSNSFLFFFFFLLFIFFFINFHVHRYTLYFSSSPLTGMPTLQKGLQYF